MVGAASPEELETLLEDAVLLGDGAAVTDLFESAGVLVVGHGPAVDRRLALDVLRRQSFVASVRSVTVVRDVAVVVGDRTVTVSCRSRDHGWRLLAMVVSHVQPLGVGR
jgi:hypothetical protein